VRKQRLGRRRIAAQQRHTISSRAFRIATFTMAGARLRLFHLLYTILKVARGKQVLLVAAGDNNGNVTQRAGRATQECFARRRQQVHLHLLRLGRWLLVLGSSGERSEKR